MSNLSPEAIKEFKDIHYQETGEDLSEQEAVEMANRVFNFFRVIYAPIEEADGNDQRISN